MPVRVGKRRADQRPAAQAALPTPQLSARRVPLRVRCGTRAELTRVAELMEVPIIGGRAGRRFGRVRIDAVTPGEPVG
jgi:hypothetical protein